MPVFLPQIEDDLEYVLVGVSCHERDYRMVWRVNKMLHWNLERADDVLHTSGKRESVHSCFRMVIGDENIIITWYQNKTGEGILLPEFAQFDYLLKVENAPRDFITDALMQLRRTIGVRAVMEFDPEKIKSVALL
ncbi:MAG: IPExxxVDY family protein [Flavobacteriales bacterium]|nr:IPExxxVDY family protein [Flavobacteriales bacterium]